MADGPLLRLDARVSAALRHPDRFSEILSDLGNVEVAVPVLAVVLVLAGLRRRSSGTDHWWLPSLAGAVATAVVPALVVPLKVWTDRPGTPAVPPATGYFPSGHTATAALAYGSAALVLLPLLRTPAARRAVVGAGAALVLAVSYGLVRRGYHWPLDVVASWCLATVLLTLLALALGRAGRTGRGGGGGPGQPK
ncbi:phosphatase PAP2 family protein [Streptomyces sp. NPDC101249]|uniref:phosphatase PAP2 family protein n=1 Tax=Streptomyces sp. NPDC101249 TaxID=3366140 RepID=UPI00380626DE